MAWVTISGMDRVEALTPPYPFPGAPSDGRVHILVDIIQELSLARELGQVVEVVRRGARRLTGADGATFILRDGESCHYVNEDAIGPLWKGSRFPLSSCISGWAMLHQRPVVIEDIYKDDRIPWDLYRPTFVRSLAMVPIRATAPIGAIGNYWASHHAATPHEVELLCALADSTSVALENVQLYADLQRRITQVEEAVRVRDEFLAVAAHELKTPLTVLQGRTELLLRQSERALPAADDRLRASVATLHGQSQRLAELVGRLFDVVQLEIGQFEIRAYEHDLSRLARDAVREFTETYPAISFGCECPDGIVGRVDAERVGQALRNLLSNAVRHSGPNARSVQVSVEQHEGNIRIAVRDHGPGIGDDVRARLGQRRGGQLRKGSGLGLGLYITTEIARLHGGTLDLGAAPGGGTLAVLTLPLTGRAG